MTDETVNKIETIIKGRKRANYKLAEHSNLYKEYQAVEEKAFKDGEISKLNKELMALGISLITNCESCMEWHIHQALIQGAKEKQFFEVIDLAIGMSGGSATVTSRFTLDVIEYYKNHEI